jgi:hypothetical protein
MRDRSRRIREQITSGVPSAAAAAIGLLALGTTACGASRDSEFSDAGALASDDGGGTEGGLDFGDAQFLGEVGIPSADASATFGDAGAPPWVRPAPNDNCGTGCYWGLPGTAPANPSTLFGGAPNTDPASAPGIMYPLQNSMHAINILQMTVQWTRSDATQSLFRIRIAGAKNWDFYAGCDHPAAVAGFSVPSGTLANECVFTLPTGSWGAAAWDNKGASVQLTVAATDGQGGAVATSPALVIDFTPDAVQGAFYYWSTTKQGTMRAPLGSSKASLFVAPGSPANPHSCGGCHSVSRNGDVIAFAATDDNNAQDSMLTAAPTAMLAAPVIKPPPPPIPLGMHNASLMTLSPQGDRLLVSANEGVLSLWNTQSGAKIMDVPPSLLGGYGATCRDWSPDGQSIAVTLSPPASYDADWAVKSGTIAVMPYNNGSFGTASVVVGSTTEIHSCPSFSPDGKWLVFVSSPAAGQYKDSSQNPRSHLQLVSTQGGTVYDLANATQQDQTLLGVKTTPELGAYSTWPKFAPYVQGGGNLMFITFHSRMDYGFVLPNHVSPTATDLSNNANPQLWLAAIDVSKVSGGGDPSYAPAWLPLQDITDRNHLGFWTEKIGCTTDTQCGNDGQTNCDKCTAGQCIGVACPMTIQ